MRWIIAAICLAYGFPAYSQTVSDSAMCQLSSPLTRLARAVDAYVSDNPRAGQMHSDDVLSAATEHDRSLLDPFRAYDLSVQVEGRNSSVLVCTANKTKALLEDAGCSARVDGQLWREGFLCGFTLDLSAVCAGSARPTVNLCR